METIKYGSKTISYNVVKGRRKRSVAIQVVSPFEVVVRVPRLVDMNAVNQLVQKKARWIDKKQKQLEEVERLEPKREFVSGEELLFLGKPYRLEVIEDTLCGAGAEIAGSHVIVRAAGNNRGKEYIRRVLKNLYLQQAKEYVARRVLHFSELTGTNPDKVIVKEQKARWGSCSNKGVVRINWKIIMAPESVADYVILHELCHLKVLGHNKRFWQQVALVMPGYEKHRQWLKAYGILLKL